MTVVAGAPAPSRRQFIRRALALGAFALPADDDLLQVLAQTACTEPPGGELIRVLPLYGVGAVDTPLGQRLGGSGLDARQFTDVSGLSRTGLITPSDQVFVRTAAAATPPQSLDTWAIGLRSTATTPPMPLAAADLARQATPRGVHLIECAGNSNPQNFGLISAAAWDGVPLAQVVDRVARPAGATGVLVAGFDDERQRSLRSQPGASWVFPAALLGADGPFLATRMNGAALSNDHGAPVRLVVPGWYGCAWIKWVDQIRWVGADEPATAQMREFAGRTHQDGTPALAGDYAPPAIDTAAMPVRVEQRRIDGRLEYDVVGIVWGGATPVDALTIHFGSRDPGTVVPVCPRPATARTWAMWRHRWRPTEPGYYDITLKVVDRAVRTRRLDLSFYIRRVRIDDV